MYSRLILLCCFALLAGISSARAIEFHNAQLETQVEALFADNRDFGEIKLTIDRMLAPDVDVAASLAVIDAMAADIERMRAAVGATSDFDKLAILRRYLYEPGAWNGGKVFSYDPEDPLGRQPENRLLSDYLADRKGNCVSMPTLMMVLGNRMGLTMTLAQAPYHTLVKFTGSDAGNGISKPPRAAASPARATIASSCPRSPTTRCATASTCAACRARN